MTIYTKTGATIIIVTQSYNAIVVTGTGICGAEVSAIGVSLPKTRSKGIDAARAFHDEPEC